MIKSSAILLSVLCTGCSMIHTRTDRPIPAATVDAAAGRSSYREVLEDLGPPARLTALPGGFAFIYESMAVREMQFGISGPASIDWLSLLKFTFADADLHHQVLVFHFRDDGSLRSVAGRDTDRDLGSSGAVQALVAVASVVDVSNYLDDSAAPLEWGRSLCSPLPVALNMQQSLRTGDAGLELSGTPVKIGQHTLEMR